ncbi:BSP-domain-containing protein [Hypoxylon crocopeplum]|nr:BSP-domain-containing protein [Hypoxylon crocopeplum]
MNDSNLEDILPEIDSLHISLALSQDKGEKEENETSSPMSLPPNTTPVPKPVFMPGMSHRNEEPEPAAPTSTAVPVSSKDSSVDKTKTEEQKTNPRFELPRLRLHVQDIGHEGSSIFLSAVNASTVLRSSINSIHEHLYSGLFVPTPTPSSPSSSPFPSSLPTHPHPPPTRSVTVILRDMDGVAYTTGSDLDSDHKEIHFSLRYIASISPPSRRGAEIEGVLTHELVHCYQWNGLGSAPGGLIEGVADWVRLRSEQAPPHWRRDEAPAKWDAGYQHTAYFLQYLEDRFGAGTVRRLNEKLRKERYEEKAFWTELVGGPVEQLFEDYRKTLKKGGNKS